MMKRKPQCFYDIDIQKNITKMQTYKHEYKQTIKTSGRGGKGEVLPHQVLGGGLLGHPTLKHSTPMGGKLGKGWERPKRVKE